MLSSCPRFQAASGLLSPAQHPARSLPEMVLTDPSSSCLLWSAISCACQAPSCARSVRSSVPSHAVQIHARQRQHGAIPLLQSLGTPGVDPVSAGKPDFSDCRQLLEEFLPNLWQEQLMVAREGPPPGPPTTHSFRREMWRVASLASLDHSSIRAMPVGVRKLSPHQVPIQGTLQLSLGFEEGPSEKHL